MEYKGTHTAKRELYTNAVNYYNNNKITITNCAIKYGISRHNLSTWIRNNNGKTNLHGKQLINSDIFNSINTEEKAYWLGFMYADGNVSSTKNAVSLELALKDEEHLIKFNTFLGKSKEISKDSFRVRCLFSDTTIHTALIKLGCVPKKSLVLTFPTSEQVPKELLKHFIRGYMDGDGSVFITNNNLKVSILGTKEFLQGVIEEIGLPSRTLYKNNKNNTSNCYWFEYSGVNAIALLNQLYENSTVCLERKKRKYLEFKER
jgi:hypothetical protein